MFGASVNCVILNGLAVMDVVRVNPWLEADTSMVVVDVTVPWVIVKTTPVLVAGIVTVAGKVTEGFDDVRVMIRPPAGAGEGRLMEPLIAAVEPPTNKVVLIDSVKGVGVTVSREFWVNPSRLADTTTWPSPWVAPVGMAKVSEVAPAGIVTTPGGIAFESLLVK